MDADSQAECTLRWAIDHLTKQHKVGFAVGFTSPFEKENDKHPVLFPRPRLILHLLFNALLQRMPLLLGNR